MADTQTPCESLSYSLRRLVRGLASSREGARQGFAATLTALLDAVPEGLAPLATVLDLILNTIELKKNQRAQVG